MGSRLFNTIWEVASCAAYCDAQTAYNKRTANGKPFKSCNFFTTYVLTAYMADGQVTPQGQYCSLYTEAWPISYAKNGGSWSGKDQYRISYSFGYARIDPGIDPLVGDSAGAVSQAIAEIRRSKLESYCNSAVSSASSQAAIDQNRRRAVAASVPVDLRKYPASIVTSACRLAFTSSIVASSSTSPISALSTSSSVTASSLSTSSTTTSSVFSSISATSSQNAVTNSATSSQNIVTSTATTPSSTADGLIYRPTSITTTSTTTSTRTRPSTSSPTYPACVTQPVQNPGFENGISSWTTYVPVQTPSPDASISGYPISGGITFVRDDTFPRGDSMSISTDPGNAYSESQAL
jgi:hypothetical protein